jgi:hypothetical protein
VSFTRQEAPDPLRSALRSLRPSLNTPVVVVEDLPAGPASAAIACFGDPAGSQVVLAIRSERSGQAIFFGPDDEVRDWQAPDLAVDAALSFAESMGFLFEEDRLALAPAETRRLWGELLDGCTRRPLSGSASARAAPRALASSASAGPEGEGPWLEEIAPAVRAVSHSVSLTKFRRAPAALPRPSAAPDRPAARPLGRFRVGLQRRSS